MCVPYKFHVCVLFAVFAVIQPTTGQNPPTWNTGTSFTKTSSDCREITDLSATSETGDTVLYSVVFQTPNAGFTVDTNFASDTILTCDENAVSQSSYVVVVRVKYQSDAGQSDLTITITFTDQSSATGPTWNTGTSHTLDKTDANACNSVTTLSATSTDSSTVTYSIQGSSVFTITGRTLSCTLGDIILSSYTVVVRANQDNNVPTDITLTITVTGLSVPVFVDPDPDSTKDGHKIYMSENLQKGDAVMTLNAIDEDSDDSSLIFSMEGSSDDVKALFEIVGNTLKIKSTVADNAFDYEKEGAVKSYAIVLKVTDVSGLSSTLETSIELENENEFAPVFTSASEASISESSSPGTTVIKLVASDQDGKPEFNKVSFSIGGDDAATFVLGGSSTDEIIVKVGATFDYRTKSSYTLTVTASDSDPDVPKTTDQELIIKILTAPSFTSPINNDKIDVNEDSADGYLVKTLEASDKDGDTVTYTIVSQTPDDPVKFAVQNNELKTKGTFNVDVADAVQSYTLSLKVSDGNDKTDDETIQVEINIKDSNTQSPKFKTGVSYEASVKETAEIGFKVLTVTATDDDLTETNNKVTYSLGSVTEFIIGETSGEITVASELSYNTKSSYDVTVTAKDNGGKSATQNVKITILAEPVFTNIAEAVTREIKENVVDGTSVFVLTVQDSDDTWNGVIEIASQSPGEMFKTDGDTLKTNTNSFDAETTTAYVVTFQVTDGDFTVTSEKLTINVLDVNDEKPSITAIEEITKPETLAVDEVVVDSIEATDKDISKPNNDLVYAITSGNDGDIFKIKESSGKIQLNTPFSKSTYTLEVTVSDKGDPVLSATTEITINVDASTVDECADAPCKNGATCSSSVNKYSCQCVAGFEGENCQTNEDECLSDPCENNGNCTGSANGYTCSCQPGYGGERCQNDIDECLSQPCENNGVCVNAINGFVCSCDQGYEGYKCQNEIGDQTTLIIVVLISSISVLSIVVLATVCCCLMYRREHKKTKLEASNVLNGGNMQSTKEVETVSKKMKEGHFNEIVYDEIKDTRGVETVSKEMKEEHFDEIVYEEIKDNTEADVADYESPVTGVEQPKDADGYLKFADNDQTVGYYKLKHTKTDDYTKLKHTKTDYYTNLSGCES